MQTSCRQWGVSQDKIHSWQAAAATVADAGRRAKLTAAAAPLWGSCKVSERSTASLCSADVSTDDVLVRGWLVGWCGSAGPDRSTEPVGAIVHSKIC